MSWSPPPAVISCSSVPARHFSAAAWTATTMYASWAAIGPRHRCSFSGDTGFSESFDDVGLVHGPFHLTPIAIGAYDPLWPDIHQPGGSGPIHRMLTRRRRAAPAHPLGYVQPSRATQVGETRRAALGAAAAPITGPIPGRHRHPQPGVVSSTSPVAPVPRSHLTEGVSTTVETGSTDPVDSCARAHRGASRPAARVPGRTQVNASPVRRPDTVGEIIRANVFTRINAMCSRPSALVMTTGRLRTASSG